MGEEKKIQIINPDNSLLVSALCSLLGSGVFLSIFLFKSKDAIASLKSALALLVVIPAWTMFCKMQDNQQSKVNTWGKRIGIAGLVIAMTGFITPALRYYNFPVFRSFDNLVSRRILAVGIVAYQLILPIAMIMIGVRSLKSKVLPGYVKPLPLLYGSIFIFGLIFNMKNAIAAFSFVILWAILGIFFLNKYRKSL